VGETKSSPGGSRDSPPGLPREVTQAVVSFDIAPGQLVTLAARCAVIEEAAKEQGLAGVAGS
jgi:hypothetical protein